MSFMERPRNNNGAESDPESVAEKVAGEKLTRLLDDNFRDFAVRFMNIEEYEGLLEKGVMPGGNAYAPKIKNTESPEAAPTFKEYLEQCTQETWPAIISKETDWPQGAMSVRMYTHLLNLFKQASENVKKEPHAQPFRTRVINEMKDLVEAKVQNEASFREWLFYNSDVEPQDTLDYLDRQYDIFLLALELPQLKEKIAANIEKIQSLVGDEEWQTMLALFESELLMHRSVHKIALPPAIQEKISLLPIEDQTKHIVFNLADEIFNYKLSIKSFGGENSIELVRQWLENPASVDMRQLINVVTDTQMSDYEERQYHMALIVDLAAVNPVGWSQAYGGWGHIKPGESVTQILGAISIMPNKEKLRKIIELSHQAGTAAHPVFDNHGNARFPKGKL